MVFPDNLHLKMKNGFELELFHESTWDRVRYGWWLRLDIGISALFTYYENQWSSKLHLHLGNVWLEGTDLIEFFDTIHLAETHIPEILEQLSKMKFED